PRSTLFPYTTLFRSEVLREELAEEHLDEGGDEKRQHGADEDAGSGRDRRAAEGVADGRADQRLGYVADEQPGDGDAQLGAGEHERRPPRDRQCAVRTAITGGRTGAEAGADDGHVRECLRDDVTGGQSDEDDDEAADVKREQPGQRRPPARGL